MKTDTYLGNKLLTLDSNCRFLSFTYINFKKLKAHCFVKSFFRSPIIKSAIEKFIRNC